ncbi:MAG TPA: hypothetical protein DCE41_07600 [Cytophagales bacterium]|nr:hypothetical protein [Cytophagales bacterium]HAA20885.1 hypothetical protein [Cytophagales bacterium]HAP58546.1 hypothetical protein [Cytophagales bacterium]
MKVLLDKLEVIQFKYQVLRDQNTFNIFEILRDKSDEVHLHSRFIVELLSPNGTHQFQDGFFQLFLPIIDVNDFAVEDYQVFKEYKNIDVLIKNRTQAIIIENKIWARDQPKQLERYYHTMKEEGFEDIRVVYLTLQGTEPSDSSRGRLAEDEVGLFSYAHHINVWIEKCIEAASRHAELRETLIQYQKLIKELSGNSMGVDQTQEIIQLLREDDNIVKAHLIASNWKHVQWHTENDFWIELKGVILERYQIIDDQSYDPDYLDKLIHQKRNRNAGYGWMFKIADFQGFDLCVFIERSFEDVYFGLTALKDGNRDASDDPKLNELADRIKRYCGWQRETSWLGGHYFEPRINFEMFSNEETLRLSNPDFRTQSIQKYWGQVDQFITNISPIISELK